MWLMLWLCPMPMPIKKLFQCQRLYSEIRSHPCTHNNSFVAVCRPTNLVQDDDPQHSGGVRSCWCVRCRCRSRNCSDAKGCTVKVGKNHVHTITHLWMYAGL